MYKCLDYQNTHSDKAKRSLDLITIIKATVNFQLANLHWLQLLKLEMGMSVTKTTPNILCKKLVSLYEKLVGLYERLVGLYEKLVGLYEK